MILTNETPTNSVNRVFVSLPRSPIRSLSASRCRAFSWIRKIRIPGTGMGIPREFRASRHTSRDAARLNERQIVVGAATTTTRNYREALSGKATIELRESREGHLRASHCRLSRSVWREKVAITIARSIEKIALVRVQRTGIIVRANEIARRPSR
jgi:hypothetical protein